MQLPLEILQQIKEYSNYREAKIIHELGIGWKTKKMEYHESIVAFVEQLLTGDLHVRLYGTHMYYGNCASCRFAPNPPSSEDLFEIYHHQPLDNQQKDVLIQDLIQAAKYAVFVDLELESVEEFGEFHGYLKDLEFFSGPLLPMCLPYFRGRWHYE